MEAARLEGAYGTLERLTPNDVKELHDVLQDSAFYYLAGYEKPPELQSVKETMEDEYFVVWRAMPEGGDAATAYAGIVGYSGPPFVFIHFLDGEVDLEQAQDYVLLIVHAFFEHSDETELWTYYPKPVPDEIHETLVESGFDPYMDDELPGIDLEAEAAYRMERHTYDAYWGEDSESVEL